MIIPLFSKAALRTHHDGTREFVKWMALAARLVDHVGFLVFGRGKCVLHRRPSGSAAAAIAIFVAVRPLR